MPPYSDDAYSPSAVGQNERNEGHSSFMDEEEMNRKLADIESSFLPEGIHLAHHPEQMQQTRSPHRLRSSAAQSMANGVSNVNTVDYANISPSRSNGSRRDPPSSYTHGLQATSAMLDNGSSLLSSPTAAAAQRNKLRAAASDAKSERHPFANRNIPSLRPYSQLSHPLEHVPPPDHSEPYRPRSAAPDLETVMRSEPVTSLTSRETKEPMESASAKTDDEQIPESSRSEQMKARIASQRSSASSMPSYTTYGSAGLEHTEGSGIETPLSRSTIKPEHDIPRLPSLGSIASSLSGTEGGRRRRRLVGTSSNDARKPPTSIPESSPIKPELLETPRATQEEPVQPTDTVVARHVSNVNVPNTVAREFGAANRIESSAFSNSSIKFGKSKEALTLKEQNQKVDKLSKENFDLKLKIHYLYQALQSRSDEGVKDLVSKNAELSTDLIKARKDNQQLRKKLRELERQMREREGGLLTRSNVEESEDGASSWALQQNQLEEELSYLRERLQSIEAENDRLQREGVTREFEKRQIADRFNTFTSREQPQITPDTFGASDTWRELYEEEKGRRQRAEREIEELYQEISRMKNDRSPLRADRFRPPEGVYPEGFHMPSENDSLSGTTLVEQLKQENAELRRDLGAQTSMLTSRNRERERLQQEIEDLKIYQRRGDGPRSITGDSIFDRSVSRQNQRPGSRGSVATPLSQYDELDRDRLGALRDENAALKLRNQDLQQDLDILGTGAEHLQSIRAERDDALRILEEERDYATTTIDQLEEAVEQKSRDIHKLLNDLRGREDETGALQQEIQMISERVSRLADDNENSRSLIAQLRVELSSTQEDLDISDQNLTDANTAKERLEVRAESSENEIAFLREEQESDKLRIGDLETALQVAKATQSNESFERQRQLDALQYDLSQARENAKQLKKSLSIKSDSLHEVQQSFNQYHSDIAGALGNAGDPEQGHFGRITALKAYIEDLLQELETTQRTSETQQRDLGEHRSALDSYQSEIEKLSSILDKERSARKRDKLLLEQARQSPTQTQHVSELETALSESNHRINELQKEHAAKVDDRNTLILNLWDRLTELLGPEWAQRHSTISKIPSSHTVTHDLLALDEPFDMALLTLENTLSTFRARIRTTEKDIYKDFQSLEDSLEERTRRIAKLEAALKRHPQTHNASHSRDSQEVARLKDENKLLRRELRILKEGAFALPGLPPPRSELERAAAEAAEIGREVDGQKMPSVTSTDSARIGMPSVSRTEENHQALQKRAQSSRGTISDAGTANTYDNQGTMTTNSRDAYDRSGYPHGGVSDQRWVLRLKELEKRLKQEREGRLIDRDGARKRLEEKVAENEELGRALEREREREVNYIADQDRTSQSSRTRDGNARYVTGGASQ